MTRDQQLNRERGSILVMTAVALVALVGMLGFVADIGRLVWAQRVLQATTDSAAAAGAMVLPDDTAANNVANLYSATTGNKNARTNLSGVTYSSVTTCDAFLQSQSLPCVTLVNKRAGSPTQANLFTVTQRATVNMTFARVLGMTSWTVTAVAKAGMRGGLRPLNIVVVVDTTASMGNNDSSCGSTGVPSQDRIDCAKLGVRTLLGCVTASGPCNLDPTADAVGLMVFPGLKSSTPLSRDYDCTGNLAGSDIAAYNASPVYSIVPLSTNFRTGFTLNGSGSNLVKAVDYAHGAGCTTSNYGLENPGGMGTYYAGAIAAAQASFPVGANKQNVIILLSDGDAGASANMGNHPCTDAVTQATAAANAGTWVYSIAYGSSTGSSCGSSDAMTACQAMQKVAQSKGKSPDPTKFYSDTIACSSINPFTAMDQIFAAIGRDLTTTRLIP